MFKTLGRCIALAGLAITAACSTDTTGPRASAVPEPLMARTSSPLARESSPSTATVKILPRKEALLTAATASATIGPEGGTVSLPQTGFLLWIPPGALDKKTRISVKAEAGSGVAYHFEPHGLQFNVPVWFSQQASFAGSIDGKLLKGGYFKDDKQVDHKNGEAVIDEAYQINLDPLGVILFGITHFSGYLVSCA